MPDPIHSRLGAHNVPADHADVLDAINRFAVDQLGPCEHGAQGGGDHDVDVVYTARLRVRDAYCLRCGIDLPIPTERAAAPGRQLRSHTGLGFGPTLGEMLHPRRVA